MNFNMFLPGFEEVQITKMEKTDNGVALYVEMELTPHRCPSCQAITSKVHDYRIQKIRHLKIFERPSFVFYRKTSIRMCLWKEIR